MEASEEALKDSARRAFCALLEFKWLQAEKIHVKKTADGSPSVIGQPLGLIGGTDLRMLLTLADEMLGEKLNEDQFLDLVTDQLKSQLEHYGLWIKIVDVPQFVGVQALYPYEVNESPPPSSINMAHR